MEGRKRTSPKPQAKSPKAQMMLRILGSQLQAASASSVARCFASNALVVKPDWKSIKVPEATLKDAPTPAAGGANFPGDLRSWSGLGLGDGCRDHTSKWLQPGLSGTQKSPQEFIAECEPIKVEGPVVASYGSDDPLLGCPVEYINLRGTSKEDPAVCKYTGNRYYSDPHTWRHH